MKRIFTTLLLMGGISSLSNAQTCLDGETPIGIEVDLSGVSTNEFWNGATNFKTTISYGRPVNVIGVRHVDLEINPNGISWCNEVEFDISSGTLFTYYTPSSVESSNCGTALNNYVDFVAEGNNFDAETGKVVFEPYEGINDGGVEFVDQTFGEGSKVVIYGCPTGVVFPVKLTSFIGTNKNGANLLSWSATSEINFSHYLVEVSSDGTNWQSIKQVEKNHNNELVNNYTFEHNNPYTQTYYRLNMVDLDGSSQYSNILSLTNEEVIKTISLFPNPTQDLLIVNSSEEVEKVEVYNSRGVLMTSKKGNNKKLNVSNLLNGMYIIKIQTKNGVQTQKFIKN